MSSTVVNSVENNEDQNAKKNKLPFGHYKVRYSELSNNCEGFSEIVCKPLSQEDYANSWQVVLPRPSKYYKQPIHHWSVTLAQLPPHLWSKYKEVVDEDGRKFYPIIRDNIYHYTVTKTEHDETLRALREELQCGYKANKNIVHKYVKELYGLNSWLVVRALNFLKGNLENDVVYN